MGPETQRVVSRSENPAKPVSGAGMYTTARHRYLRIILVALLSLTGLVACTDSDNKLSQLSVVDARPAAGAPPQYASSCAACHIAGAAGAPRSGDTEAWAARLEAKGMDGLVASVRNGLNAMPPGGLCNSCSDEDHVALISFMAAAQ